MLLESSLLCGNLHVGGAVEADTLRESVGAWAGVEENFFFQWVGALFLDCFMEDVRHRDVPTVKSTPLLVAGTVKDLATRGAHGMRGGVAETCARGPSCKTSPRSWDLVEFERDPVPLRGPRHRGVQCVSITQVGRNAQSVYRDCLGATLRCCGWSR